MTVRITKPEFNLREKISELDKPSGLKGNEILKSETSQEVRNLINADRRNLFDNGACEVKQRGSSFSSAGWTADRWYMYATGGTTTIETSSPPSGFTHYLQAASATSSCIFSQGIELKNQGSAGQFKQGQIMTVSWYAKTTATGGEKMKLNASFRSASTSGTNLVALTDGIHGYNLGGGEVHITNSWARYSRTFKINVSPHSSNKILVMQIRTPSGAIGTVSLTGFQCEFGSEPTEFEHRSFAEELALCQRYFQSNFPIGVAPQNGYYSTNANLAAGFNGVVSFASNYARSPWVMFHPKMRDTPTVTLYSASSSDTAGRWAAYKGSWNSGSSHVIDYFGGNGFGVRFETGGHSFVTGEAYLYRGMWKAEAEI